MEKSCTLSCAHGPHDVTRAGKGDAIPGSQVPSLEEPTDTSHLCQDGSPQPLGPHGPSRPPGAEGSGGPDSQASPQDGPYLSP